MNNTPEAGTAAAQQPARTPRNRRSAGADAPTAPPVTDTQLNLPSFRWEEPPTNGGGVTRNPEEFKAEADLLRSRPNSWACVHEYVNKAARSSAFRLAKAIKEGTKPAFAPPGAFEARSATVDGGHRVYARYIPPAETDGTDA